MNCAVYIFGELSSGYTQYPEDSSSSILKNLYSKCKATTQIVIHRDSSMMYYCYIRKISDSRYLGLCIAVNGYYISKVEELFALFENIIEKIAQQGSFIHFSDDGSLTTSSTKLSREEEEIDTLSENLRHGFETLGSINNKLPQENYSVAKDSVKEFNIFDDKKDIIRATYTYGYTFVYKDKDFNTVRVNSYRSVLSRLNETNLALKKENAELQEKNQEILRQKKQFKNVVFLILVIVGCLVGLYLFYNEVNDKAARIADLENTVTERNATIADRDSTIVGLQTSLSNLHSDLESIASYSASTGATLRNNDNHDNGWILWLNAKRKVRIESFYIKGQTSGTVDIGLYDTNDNLIASCEASAASGEFRKVNVGSEWTIKNGVYYMKIRSGVSLQYHSSGDREYSQFTGGALEVTGASGYGDRNDTSKQTNHNYYQYFYNIQYRLLVD